MNRIDNPKITQLQRCVRLMERWCEVKNRNNDFKVCKNGAE